LIWQGGLLHPDAACSVLKQRLLQLEAERAVVDPSATSGDDRHAVR
jgi:hypothetical protein